MAHRDCNHECDRDRREGISDPDYKTYSCHHEHTYEKTCTHPFGDISQILADRVGAIWYRDSRAWIKSGIAIAGIGYARLCFRGGHIFVVVHVLANGDSEGTYSSSERRFRDE